MEEVEEEQGEPLVLGDNRERRLCWEEGEGAGEGGDMGNDGDMATGECWMLGREGEECRWKGRERDGERERGSDLEGETNERGVGALRELFLRTQERELDGERRECEGGED